MLEKEEDKQLQPYKGPLSGELLIYTHVTEQNPYSSGGNDQTGKQKDGHKLM